MIDYFPTSCLFDDTLIKVSTKYACVVVCSETVSNGVQSVDEIFYSQYSLIWHYSKWESID